MKKTDMANEIGKTYGKLTIIEALGQKMSGGYMQQYVKVICSCENKTIKECRLCDIKSGNTKGCGLCKGNHNLYYTRLHRIWGRMKQRCSNPKLNEYKNYGGKGIIVCDSWKSNFKTFYDWAMENGYTDELTIDRIDSNGNYEPSNCRWITKSENSTKANLERAYIGTRVVKGIDEYGKEYIFDNIREFAEKHHLDASAICKVCNGKIKHHKNWKFSYID